MQIWEGQLNLRQIFRVYLPKVAYFLWNLCKITVSGKTMLRTSGSAVVWFRLNRCGKKCEAFPPVPARTPLESPFWAGSDATRAWFFAFPGAEGREVLLRSHMTFSWRLWGNSSSTDALHTTSRRERPVSSWRKYAFFSSFFLCVTQQRNVERTRNMSQWGKGEWLDSKCEM